MKKIVTSAFSLCLSLALAVPAFATDYSISAPSGPEYGKATSIEVIYTADGGAARNEDVSKNAAMIPPAFGSPSADALNTGEYLTPNLAPKAMVATGAGIGGATVAPPIIGSAELPTSPSANYSFGGSSTVTVTGTEPYNGIMYTDVTRDLYYSGGYLATLKIPAIGVNVKVYEGTDSATLAKGAGHFEETSIWNGRVAIAGHNRGANCCFGEIHTLSIGDRITLTTKLGTRTYAVTSVDKVSETDRSGLASSSENVLTLYTCVRNQSSYRWRVTAAQVN